jgi:hypothetical protein
MFINDEIVAMFDFWYKSPIFSPIRRFNTRITCSKTMKRIEECNGTKFGGYSALLLHPCSLREALAVHAKNRRYRYKPFQHGSYKSFLSGIVGEKMNAHPEYSAKSQGIATSG